MMRFTEMPSIPGYKEKIWGAIEGKWQYVITYDPDSETFFTSYKAYPNTGYATSLGEYRTWADSVNACMAHWSLSR